jgi:hypothetical protein
MAHYIGNAVLLERNITSHDGHKLKHIWEREVLPVQDFERRWEQACQSALEHLKQVRFAVVFLWLTKWLRPLALGFLNVYNPEKVRQLLDPLVADAIVLFKGPDLPPRQLSRTWWFRTLTRSAGCRVPPLFLISKWKPLCDDVFPLNVIDKKEGIEFIIVNSTVPAPGLAGSAFGELAEPQIARLKKCIAASAQPNIIVLMHHPICRWSDEMNSRPNRDRWGLLAHNSVEARALPGILCEAAPPSCRMLALCSGHVHDIARGGPIVLIGGKTAPATFKRLAILENTALPNLGVTKQDLGLDPDLPTTSGEERPKTNGLLACTRRPDGRLSLVKVPWVALLDLEAFTRSE